LAEPQIAVETDLKSPLEITNIRNLLGAAHWPEACACCLAPPENWVDLFTYFDSRPEKIPYCQICATHPEGETKLLEFEYRKKITMFRGHSTARTRYSSERIGFAVASRFEKVYHVSFRRAVEFDPSGSSALRFCNVEYAKRFVNANGLDWPEIIKQNTVPRVKINELQGCLDFLKFPAIFLALIFLLGILFYVASRVL